MTVNVTVTMSENMDTKSKDRYMLPLFYDSSGSG